MVNRADSGVKQGRRLVIGRADHVQAAREPLQAVGASNALSLRIVEFSARGASSITTPPPTRSSSPTPHTHTATMSRNDYGSDADEDLTAGEYREQVQYDGMEELDRMPSIGSNQDIHAQLQAAATPLEFQATLETKFASYDNYCNLFHYILNSDGPVDLEVPNVRTASSRTQRVLTVEANSCSTTGPGTSSMSSSTSSTASAATARKSP